MTLLIGVMYMARFAMDAGHGNINHSLGGDGGAVGYLNEQNCNLDIVNKVTAKLRALGHEVILTRPTSANSVGNSLWKRVLASDSSGADYFVSVHFNAGGGHGSEVWYESQAGYNLGKPVLDNLVALGFTNRGMKNCSAEGEHLYVVMNPKAPAILIEVCFVDSQGDSANYNSEAAANAIVKGLIGQTSTVTSNSSTNITNSPDFPMSKESIKTIQHVLNILKIKDNQGRTLTEDGVMGTNTKGALTNFQSVVGLTTDGIYGPLTESAIKEVISMPLCGVPYVHKYATRYIQWQLGLARDGIFNAKTRDVVKVWQAKAGLVADGLFGPKSWGTMLK